MYGLDGADFGGGTCGGDGGDLGASDRAEWTSLLSSLRRRRVIN